MNARLRETQGWAELAGPAKAALLFYVAAEYMFLGAMFFAPLVALANSRLGAYLLLVVLMIHVLGRQVSLLVFAAHQDELEVPRAERRGALTSVAFMTLVVAGLYAALAGWRRGAYVAVAALLGLLASHVAVGGLAHRRVTSRPWPEVGPVVDDDW